MIVKILFIAWLISLLLMGCSQPNKQEIETSPPVDESEDVVEVAASTDQETSSDQEKQIIPPEDQSVQVIFTQDALNQIALDLEDTGSQNKVLKIKPAID